ncbi:MAG: hypothetical protein A3C44_00315 [Gammaproteobacteria bacterium RIFCSPHIGHO2_02_FULL_39_13]|nr:MAG: hypothetical protein A3C44_00315 [Gammaproteobacteria bacterium RIFCSPHIGHO2_02_FULL_39_13]OGT48671.1 MAG: hypothetical protein A3E53_05285 [Gammaproteobacteria bacterium RIFCSPHIGHO2_12_FULL_39_24]
MSVKKILLLGAAGVAAVSMSAAMAGGYTHEPAAVDDSGYYIEGHLGYARQNYFDNQNWAANTAVDTTVNNNNRGGFAAGVDAGYKINRHFGVELGWFHLPDVNVNGITQATAYLTNWVLYLAGKYMMPLPWMNNTDAFFKLGAAYRSATLSSAAVITNAVSSRKSTFVRPMFATGLDYSFSDTWSGIIQYAYFMGASNSFPFSAVNTGALGTVAANVFTLGLGYKFTV